MRNIFEQWNSFQINEGILEKETTEISREIVERFKKLAQAGTIHQSKMPFHWIEPSVPESLADVAGVKHITVKVEVLLDQSKTPHAQRQRKPVTVNGQFAAGRKELTIFLRVSLEGAPKQEDLLKATSEWLPDLKNLLRHELEPATS